MGPGAAVLNPDDLLPLLDRLQAHRLWVAFSGGLDSTALLLALAALREQRPLDLHAVHANHGVHADATAWAGHCATVCSDLVVPLTVLGPPETALPPDSPEAQLRHWRYDAFEALLDRGDVMCTAHHREDQAETVLLALLRGSGPGGIAAMPEQRSLGAGRLVRPLLSWPRAALEAFVRRQGLTWVEDPGNAGIDPDRNYLRHQVLPRLRARWPAADASLATSARLCAETRDLLEAALDERLDSDTLVRGVLPWARLAGDERERRLLLRRWLAREGCAPVPRARLEAFMAQLETAGEDRQPRLDWNGHTLRRYRGELWLDSPDHVAPTGDFSVLGTSTATVDLSDRELPSDLAALGLEPVPPALRNLTVRRRQAGDRLRPRASGPSRPLKQWLSTSPLPPWHRGALPLLCRDREVLAVADVVLDADLKSRLESSGVALRWRPSDPGLARAWERCRAALLQVE